MRAARLPRMILLSIVTCWLVLSFEIVRASAGDEAAPEGEWPLAPRPAVVSGFDPPDSPWGRGHRGVDLAGSSGQVVRSSLPGRVTFAGVIAGRSVVVVGHGATRTTYEPTVATVQVGDRVDAGQQIGRLEVRGSHCLPAACLHWGWLRGGVYLNPLELVGSERVRLLPFAGLVGSPGAVTNGPLTADGLADGPSAGARAVAVGVGLRLAGELVGMPP